MMVGGEVGAGGTWGGGGVGGPVRFGARHDPRGSSSRSSPPLTILPSPHSLLLQYPGQGMPQHNFASQHGTLHVKFIVDLPPTLTPELKAALDSSLPKP